ncbi:putative bifunctional diguanylate cyclase/phosphodiesterase [Marinomonas primoryensis]|uniref:putative bifunctional diguanylate cyclase/phosphodiesterase n=1 Tax=Marinomonas primoryensis TaxID=178399 RepID=UPI0030DDAA78|tara:strand:- start:789 stop:3182 length:2394 start_codon:yes stop_codon:yes gene_type:complete
MKLSKKINIILLPVILITFSFSAIYFYYSQKEQVFSAISSVIKDDLKHLSEEMIVSVNEADFLIRVLLDSKDSYNFIDEFHIKEKKYYLEKTFIRNIKNMDFNGNKLVSFGLLDSNHSEVFNLNLKDPFSKMKINETSENNLVDLIVKIKNKKINYLNSVIYEYQKSSNGHHLIKITRVFSPDSFISDTFYSYNHRLYVALMTVELKGLDEGLAKFTDELKENFSIDIYPRDESRKISSDSEVEILSKLKSGYTFLLSHDLWNIELLVHNVYFDKMYEPIRNWLLSLVFYITLVTFFILKWLISKQIINPVVILSNQLKLPRDGLRLNLKKQTGNNEVSVLTNKYIDLIMELDNIATHDSLTGLSNRGQFKSKLKSYLDKSIKNNVKCAIISFDLNNFKSVNDNWGHQAGDSVLKDFSDQLVESYASLNWDKIGVSEFELARISGDEFSIALSGIKESSALITLSEKILSLLEDGFSYNNNILNIGVSVGIAIFPDDADDARKLIHCADVAMYSAKNDKNNKNNNYKFYSVELEFEKKRYEMIASNLRDSLRLNEFKLVYMPIIDCKTNEICGAEALLRATSENLQSYGPAEFIPVAENSGIIKDIDYWVLEESIKQLSDWIEKYNFDGILAINFSSWQFKNPCFVKKVMYLIEKYNVPPTCIELEITETYFVSGESRSLKMLHELNQLGIKISLDDFGTGFTAFSQLIDYPINTLKIDRMFVNDIMKNSKKDRLLVDMIVEIAKIYELDVVAEGIETTEQFEYMKKIGCQKVQGFLFSKPVSKDNFINLWKNQNYK